MTVLRANAQLVEVQELGSPLIKRLLGKDGVARLKEQDEAPKLALYRVAYEGTSNGKVVGIGKVAKRWLKQAVNGIAKLMHPFGRHAPVPVYFGEHGATNDEERPAVGAVIASELDTDGTEVEALALVHFTDDELKNNIPDICSIEASAVMAQSHDGGVDVLDVEDVTGLVVAHSANGIPPGFQHATLLDQVQLLAQGGDSVEIKDVEKAIRNGDITRNDIAALDVVKDIVDDFSKAADGKQKEVDSLRADMEDLRTRLHKANDDADAAKKQVAEYESAAATKEWLSGAPDSARKYLTDEKKANLDDKGVEAVLKLAFKNSPQGDTDDSRNEWLRKTLDDSLDFYSELVPADTKTQSGSPPPPIPETPTKGGDDFANLLTDSVNRVGKQLGANVTIR